MEPSDSAHKVEIRHVTVKTTDGETISGEVNIGIRERVSDLEI